MATCKWCGASGWFLNVSVNGMCSTCEATVVPTIVRQVQILQESQRLVESGKTLKTRLGRCDDVIRIAAELMAYEDPGLTPVKPPASQLRAEYTRKREEIVTEYLQAEVKKILTRAELKPNPKAKVTEASKALLKIDEARNDFGVDNPSMDELEHVARRFVHTVEFQGYLTEAEKAEFKGSRKRALDQYQEALFFLKTDRIDHGSQKEEIGRLEAKISELGQGA